MVTVYAHFSFFENRRKKMKDWLRQAKLSLRLQAGIVIAGILSLVFGAIFVISEADQGRALVNSELNSQAKPQRGIFRPTAAQWATLTVRAVAIQRFRAEILTEGKIAFDEDRATRIYSPYAGRVKNLFVAPGDVVQKGQRIFVIDAADAADTQKDFIAALSDLNKARSQVNLTTIVEQRMANLIKDKAMALKDWQEAKANLTAAQNDFRTAEIALQAVRNRLRLIGKTDEEVNTFEKTGVISPDAPVYSPLAGTVLQRNVGPGQYVDAGGAGGDPIYRIGDVSKVWLAVYVRETDAAKVKLGQTMRFTVLSQPGRVFEAKADYVAASLDPASRRLLVRASIDNSESLLKPEMFASVSIIVDESAPSPAIPREAVVYEGDAARVWTVRDGNGVELRQIKTGLSDGPMIQVLNGLKAGEKVITKGSLFIDRAATGEG
jgi:membrane fusion protein, heavy metal efflux system